MSDVFDLDNAGSGFSLDEGDDLDALMAEAEAGIEADDEEEDTSAYFTEPTPPDRVFTAGPAHSVESQESASEESPQTEEDWDSITESITESEEPEESATVEEPPAEVTAVTEEAYSPTEAQDGESADDSVPVESEASEATVAEDRVPDSIDSALVARILRISSKYRELGEKERTVVSQFINNGKVIEAEEDLVMAVLNVDPALTRVMRALREGRELESVDRAFYVIELDEYTLRGVGSLMTVFGNEEISTELPHSKYAREVVAGIDKLDDTSMELVTATEAVLSAGEVISG